MELYASERGNTAIIRIKVGNKIHNKSKNE